MSLLLSLPSELLVNYVFVYEDIEISDLYHLMHSCSRLSHLIRKANKLWKKKCEARWPELDSILFESQPGGPIVWLDIVGLRLRVNKDVKETVGMLSSVCYPDPNSFLTATPQCVRDKFVGDDDLYIEFIAQELHKHAFMQSQLNGYEDLTKSYYALQTLKKIRSQILEKKWLGYLVKPEGDDKSLLEGAVLMSQWFGIENSILPNMLDINAFMETVAQVVLNRLGESSNTINSGASSRTILINISQVLFSDSEMGFIDMSVDESSDFKEQILNISIMNVIKSKIGCATMLCIIYQEVARRFGIRCEPVYCYEQIDRGRRLLLRWLEYPQQQGGEEFTYIDVCDGGSLKRLNPMRKLGPYRNRYNQFRYYQVLTNEPALTANSLFDQMLKPLITRGEYYLAVDHLSTTLPKFTRLYRLSCMLFFSTDQALESVKKYADHCWEYGVQLDDAHDLLRAQELNDHPLMVNYTEELATYRAKIADQKVVCFRLPSMKYAVGLIMKHSFVSVSGQVRIDICVITSWDPKYQGPYPDERGQRENLNQPFYHILIMGVFGFSGPAFYVAEDKLELHPKFDSGGHLLFHPDLGLHFEKFDGRRYVPNEEKKRHFPEDDAFASSLMSN